MSLDARKQRIMIDQLSRSSIVARNAFAVRLGLDAGAKNAALVDALRSNSVNTLDGKIAALDAPTRTAIDHQATAALLEYHRPSQQVFVKKLLAALGWLGLTGAALGIAANYHGVGILGIEGGAVRVPIDTATRVIGSTLTGGSRLAGSAFRLARSGVNTASHAKNIIASGFTKSVEAAREAREAFGKAYRNY